MQGRDGDAMSPFFFDGGLRRIQIDRSIELTSGRFFMRSQDGSGLTLPSIMSSESVTADA